MSTQDPKYLVDFLAVNVDNEKLSDEDFRQVIRNTLPLYQAPKPEHETVIDPISGNIQRKYF